MGAPIFDNTTPEFKAYNSAHDKTDIVDPRHIAPTLSQDPSTGHLYINKSHPAVPQLNVELIIYQSKNEKITLLNFCELHRMLFN